MADKKPITITIFGKRYQRKDGTGSYIRFTYKTPEGKYYDVARTNTCKVELPTHGGFYQMKFIGHSQKSQSKNRNGVIWCDSIVTIQAIQKENSNDTLADDIVNEVEEIKDEDVPF